MCEVSDMSLVSILSCEVIDSANLYLKGLITNGHLHEKQNEIANNISKTMKLDGFRKGRIPISVVNSRFGDTIKRDAEQEAISSAIKSAMKENKMDVSKILGSPIIKKYEKNDNGIDIEVQIGIFPTIVLDDYSNLVPPVSLNPITDDDIENRLSDIAKANGPLLEVMRPLSMGDIANIDFEGFIDGKAFDGGKSQGFDLEIGSKRFVDNFEDQLVGMNKGDERDISIVFPQNYNAKELAGRRATFKVKLNIVQERSAAKIDNDFVKSMLPNENEATIEKLRDSIKAQLQNENKNKLFNELRKPLIDNLLDGITFDLPNNIIDQELDVIFRNKLSNLDKDSLKELQEDKVKAEKMRESFRDDAKKSVKLTLIMDSIAKKLNITVSDNDVYQMLYYEALMVNKDPKELLDFYKQNNMIPAVKITLLEGKVINNLLESKLNN